MRRKPIPGRARVAAFLAAATCLLACGSPNRPDAELPPKMLWAWERPEDLHFIDPNEFGVAFLAQTLFLETDRVTPRSRRQPLDVADGAYMIAVTRIETNKETTRRPKFDVAMVNSTAARIRATLDLPKVKGIQIDFDAAVSERKFYRELITELKKKMPVGKGLSITALASWCSGDGWFGGLPIDEAVPMVFQMGADAENIRAFLRNGNDWPEPLCRHSYGISLEEGRFEGMKEGRRVFYFKNSQWQASDISAFR